MIRPDISIIIPFYNAKERLARCLDSVVTQTHENFEVLLIDDGSTDSSSDICTKYTIKDQRFQYHLKTNGGVSSARNLGIEKAKGKYLAFIDSDDFVDPDFCRILFECAESRKTDILNFGHTYVNGSNKTIRNPVFKDQTFVERADLLEILKNSASNKFLYFCWSRIYSREFIHGNHIRFNEKSLLGSDSLFNLTAFLQAKKIYSIDYQPYHYIYNDTSLTQRKFKEDLVSKYETQFRARIEIQKVHQDAFNDTFIRDIATNYVHNALFMLLFNVKNCNTNRIEELRSIRKSEIFAFSFQHYAFTKEITLMMKIKIFLFKHRLFHTLNMIVRFL